MKKRIAKQMTTLAAISALTISSIPMTALGYGEEVDVSSSTFKEDTDNSEAFQTWKEQVWTTERADSGKIALTPGKTESDLGFSWYSASKGTPAVKIWKVGKESEAAIVTGTATAIEAENWQGSTYAASNQVTVENYFEESSSYKYQYTDNYVADGDTEWSEAYEYNTADANDFSVILTGDPQVGASGSSSDKDVDDTSVARDTYNWNLTMQQALETAPDAALLLSAGDQIDKSGATKEDDRKTRESEYAGYLYPSVFRSLPIASTIGNHDMAGEDYSLHFNNPNASELGATAAGGDYYFSYGDVLFISLNSNNRNQEEHRELMEEAVASNEDAAWKVVIFHSDIYGSGQPHADTDAATNRIIFAPLMDEFDIDVCLTGHDHTYSRSYQILDGNVIDYDISDGSVTDPEGTLYISTGSGSGSKYYNLLNYTPYYIADRTNVCLPAFSVMDFTETSMTIKTYDYEGNQYADDFTINKTADAETAEETITRAESILASLDMTKYTAASVDAVRNAIANLESVLDKSETDGAIEIISTLYNTEEDPIAGYGSVKSNEDKDITGVDDEGNTQYANRLREGYSVLLDRTIYTQLNEETLPIIKEAELVAAQTAVNTALENLVAIADEEEETTTESADESQTDAAGDDQSDNTQDDTQNDTQGGSSGQTSETATNAVISDTVKTGDNSFSVVLVCVAAMAVALGLIGMTAGKREGHCEEK